MQLPQEVEFLQSVGLGKILIILFGLVQIAGGVLLAPKKTRMIGAVLVASVFILSTVFIFVKGYSVFGLISMLPIALTGVVIYQTSRITQKKSQYEDVQRKVPARTDFPEGCMFYIKEFDLPLVHGVNGGWESWYGGRPRKYDSSALRVDNNWQAESFEEWAEVVAKYIGTQ